MRRFLKFYQTLSPPTQCFLATVAILTIGGLLTLMIIVAVVPTAAIGITSLLSGVAGFFAGKNSKR